jgi:hypothetical protein
MPMPPHMVETVSVAKVNYLPRTTLTDVSNAVARAFVESARMAVERVEERAGVAIACDSLTGLEAETEN